MPRIVVLTGERGIGKTTVCRETVARARGEGYACSGILTLASSQGDAAPDVPRSPRASGPPVASRAPDVRLALDVRSGDARRLTMEADTAQAVDQGRFRFNPRVLRWGNEALRRATPCDLLVIDEIGPLELVRGEGWVSAFDTLEGRDFGLALVVVRPELLAQAQFRLPDCDRMVLVVTRENREQVPGTLMEMLRERT